jgi:hypothetical protein
VLCAAQRHVGAAQCSDQELRSPRGRTDGDHEMP